MKSNIKKMYIISFLNNLTLLNAVITPFLTEWGGLTFTQIFTLQSWFMMWGFILETPTGTIADMIGRKESIITGLLISGLGFTIYGITPNYNIFLIAEFIIALGNAFISGADKALIYDSLKLINEEVNANKIFGRIKASKTIGAIIGPIIGSITAKYLGLNWPIIINGLLIIIAGLIAFSLKKTMKKTKTTINNYWKTTKKGLKNIIKHKQLRTLTIDLIIITITFKFFFWLWQPSMAKAGIDIIYYGLIASIFNATSIILLTNSQKIEQKLGIKKTIIMIGLTCGASLIIIAITSNWMIIITLIITSFSLFSIREPIYYNYINQFIESKTRATTLSSITMIKKLITAILYPLIGLLIDWNINYTMIILGAIIITLTITTRVNKELIKRRG